MQLRFVDYCPLYFTELREQPVPSHREGKFVLLRNAATRYAVFSPRQLSTYHANIVERFLWGEGIPGRYNAKHDVFLALVREVADWPGPVYIHCAQGHGRTGTLAAAVLLAKGHCDSVDAALARLRAARPRLALGKAQLQFVRRIGDQVLPVQKSAGTPPIADSAAGGLTVRDEQAQR